MPPIYSNTTGDLRLRAAFEPTTFNEENRTVDLVWSTGQAVRRYDWQRDRFYQEVLKLDSESCDLTRLSNGAALLANHASQSLNDVIGVIERAWIDNGIGKATVRFSEREDVKPILQDVKTGILRSISVGYTIGAITIEERENQEPIYTATQWTPHEISLVTIPADTGAQVRSNYLTQPKKEATMPDSTEVKNEQVVMSPAVDIDAIRAETQKTERERISEIQLIARNLNLDNQATEKMITDGTSIEAARKFALDTMVKRSEEITIIPHHFSMGVDEKELKRSAKENAILGRYGFLKSTERSAKLQGNPYVNLKPCELARDILEEAGTKTRGISDEEMLQRAFTQSTSDFPVLMNNVMNKVMLDAYAETPSKWRELCRIGSVNDFRPSPRIKNSSFGTLETVNELGEFKSMPIQDGEAETIQAKTVGKIINLSRQALINDDLGAFLNLAAEFGKTANLTIEDELFALVVSGKTMSDSVALYHANHGNLAASGSVISMASIDAGRVAMASQRNVGNTNYLDIKPSILLCPTSLTGQAIGVLQAPWDPDTTKFQRPNIVRDLARIIDTPRLTGTAWYLLAAASDIPTFEVVFLNGNQEPFIDMKEGFSTDGQKYKVRLDYGIGIIDYRGIYKNSGA